MFESYGTSDFWSHRNYNWNTRCMMSYDLCHTICLKTMSSNWIETHTNNNVKASQYAKEHCTVFKGGVCISILVSVSVFVHRVRALWYEEFLSVNGSCRWVWWHPLYVKTLNCVWNTASHSLLVWKHIEVTQPSPWTLVFPSYWGNHWLQ